MQPNDLQYFLTLNDKDYKLPHAPDGWDESAFGWKIVEKYWGLFREFTLPFSFVLDGAYILRNIFYKHGTSGKSTFRVELLNRSTWEYEEIFSGDVDFSTFQDSLNKVEVSIVNGGVSKKLKAYENVEYEFDCDDFQVRIPAMDAVDWVVYDLFKRGGMTTGSYIPNFDIKSDNVDFYRVEFKDGEYSPVSEPSQSSDEWFAKGVSNRIVTIRGSGEYFFQGDLTSDEKTEYEFRVVRENGNTVATIFDTKKARTRPFQSDFYPETFTFETSFNISVGEKLYFFAAHTNGRRGIFDIGSTNIIVSYTEQIGSTIVKAKRPFELFKELVSEMTDGEFSVKSSLLETQWNNLVIVSGDSIRGEVAPIIKTSFSKFYKAIDAVLNVGMCEENGQLVLEQKEYMMPLFMLADIGEVASAEFSPDSSNLFSNIKAGYIPDDYEVERGREEFNSEQNWTTELDRSVKTLDLVSGYSADQHGIEKLRLTSILENNTSTDKKNDNKIYFLHVEKEPLPLEGGLEFTAIGGNQVVIDGDYEYLVGNTVFIEGKRYTVIDKSVTGATGVNVVPNPYFQNRSGGVIQDWYTILGESVPSSKWINETRGLDVGNELIGPIVTIDSSKKHIISYSSNGSYRLGTVFFELFNGATNVGSVKFDAGYYNYQEFIADGITHFYLRVHDGGGVLGVSCSELSKTILTLTPYDFETGDTGILYLGGQVYDVLGADQYAYISGISTRSSSYNLDITPKKNLLRHGNYLKSMQNGNGYIRFASADKNAEFSTIDWTGKFIKENEDIYLPDVQGQLFTPILAKIRTKIPFNFHKIMNTSTRGYIEFSYLGNKYRGFPIEVSQDVARNSERELTLRLTANSNISRLIRKN